MFGATKPKKSRVKYKFLFNNYIYLYMLVLTNLKLSHIILVFTLDFLGFIARKLILVRLTDGRVTDLPWPYPGHTLAIFQQPTTSTSSSLVVYCGDSRSCFIDQFEFFFTLLLAT